MMDVTVKTLDGQNKHFSIPEDTTVTQFKEKIAASIGISADTQRLIFHGRVLQDEKMLREYEVHGKVIHVVQRAPPSLSSGTSDTQSSSQSNPPLPPHIHHPPNLQSVLVGSFTFPPEILNTAQLPIDGGSLNVHINLSPVAMGPMTTINSQNPPGGTTSSSWGAPGGGPAGLFVNSSSSSGEAKQRLMQAQRNLNLAQNAISRLEGNVGSRGSNTSALNNGTTTTDVDQARSEGNTGDNTTDPTENQDSATSDTSVQQAATPSNLAELLREVQATYQRMSPFLNQICELAAADPEISSQDLIPRQRMVDHVSEAMHALSHCFHNISDINYELSAPPPRLLTAQRLPIYHSQHSPNIVINAAASRNQGGNAAPNQTATSQSVPQSTTVSSTAVPLPAFTFQSSPSQLSSLGAAVTAATGSPANGTLRGANLPVPGDDPYVFVEVGPDSLTVNSISTHVVMSEDNDDVHMETDNQETDITANAATRLASTAALTSTSSTSSLSQTSQNQGQTGRPTMPNVNVQGLSSIPGLTGEMVNSIVQSVLQAHGVRQDQPVQVNVVPVQMPGGGTPLATASGSATINITPVTATSSHSQSQTTSVRFSRTSSASRLEGAVPSASPSTSGTTSTAALNTGSSVGSGPNSQQLPPPPPLHFLHGPGVRSHVPGSAGAQGMPMFAQIPIFRQRAPGPHALLPMPLMQPTDIYLPCFSHHFITQGVREIVDHTQRLQRQSQQPGGTPQRNANENSNRAQTNTTATQQGSISANPFAALFSQLLGGASAPASGQSSGGRMVSEPGAGVAGLAAAMTSMLNREASESGRMEAAGQSAMTDDTFARIVQGIGAQASQAAAGISSGETVANFLQSLGENHSVVAGEGFLTDAFLCVAQHLTFANLFSIFLGQVDSIRGLLHPLQQFIRERVLNGSEFDERTLRSSTDSLLDELVPEVQASVEGFDVVQDIDLEATVKAFLRHQLIIIFRIIMSSSDTDSDFGRSLYDSVRRALGEFIVLMPACLRGGQADFNNLVQSRLWMASMTLTQLSTFRSSVSIPESEVQSYIVRPSTTAAGSITAAASTVSRNVEVSSSQHVMEVEAAPPGNGSTARPTAQAPRTLDLTRNVQRADGRQEERPSVNGLRQALVNGNHDSSAASPSSATRSPRNGEENWQEVVSPEWVPIIETDIQRQKTHHSHAPLSDAYLQGMPPKRRRLMTCDRPNNLSNMADYLPTAVKRAATQAGVEPVSSVDNLAAEASDAEELQNMLEAEVQRSLANRLASDDDYSADRFPNAQQYFNSKPKPS
ncbi:hypothetical protein C0Q70_18126 [Pomacea canaliculata]|uniref:BCL2-associated athanogene 6 n=1 Tax=Pomacea canaliculata TaxID=400727 RepID=A0A2T7NMB0_POMCA|nr:hypothetical protein C0Q70_18126 [Pomacea canaliculata]